MGLKNKKKEIRRIFLTGGNDFLFDKIIFHHDVKSKERAVIKWKYSQKFLYSAKLITKLTNEYSTGVLFGRNVVSI